MTNNEIDFLCDIYGIKNYTINDDGSVDVNESVNLSFKIMGEIRLKFGRVTGNFSVSGCSLTNLIGSPKIVYGDYYCEFNLLTSLEGCPNEIWGHFVMSYNDVLKNFDYFPKMINNDIFINNMDSLQSIYNSCNIGGRVYYNKPERGMEMDIITGEIINYKEYIKLKNREKIINKIYNR